MTLGLDTHTSVIAHILRFMLTCTQISSGRRVSLKKKNNYSLFYKQVCLQIEADYWNLHFAYSEQFCSFHNVKGNTKSEVKYPEGTVDVMVIRMFIIMTVCHRETEISREGLNSR